MAILSSRTIFFLFFVTFNNIKWMWKYQAVQSMSVMRAKLQNEKKYTFFPVWKKMFTRFAVAKIDNQVFFSSVRVCSEFRSELALRSSCVAPLSR